MTVPKDVYESGMDLYRSMSQAATSTLCSTGAERKATCVITVY